jgi:hypothetical protein
LSSRTPMLLPYLRRGGRCGKGDNAAARQFFGSTARLPGTPGPTHQARMIRAVVTADIAAVHCLNRWRRGAALACCCSRNRMPRSAHAKGGPGAKLAIK